MLEDVTKPRPGLRTLGLRPRILATILAVYLVTLLLMLVAFAAINERIANRLGDIYARMQVRASRALIQDPLAREIALARQMAASPLLRSWAEDENDSSLRTLALAELEGYRKRFTDGSWFYAIDASRHYYYNDASNNYAGRELAYTLDPGRPSDGWYFASRERVSDWALNVSPGEQLGVLKVWINVLVRGARGDVVAMAGSGLDLSTFLRRFVDRQERGIQDILIDRDMNVQAHPNKAFIDFNAVVRPRAPRVTAAAVLGPENLDRLKPTLTRIAAGRDEVEVVPLVIEGRHTLVGVAYIPEMHWFTLAMVDFKKIVGWPVFLPLLGLAVVSLLVLTTLTGWIIDRTVLRRLAPLATSVKRLEQGDGEVQLPAAADDEIGRLTVSFARMAATVLDHTRTLESQVRARTESLEQQKDALNRKNLELQETLAHVRTLEQLLPVCAGCKRIRIPAASPGATEQWIPLEDYVRDRMPVRFSHGLCVDCMRRLYPELSESVIAEASRSDIVKGEPSPNHP